VAAVSFSASRRTHSQRQRRRCQRETPRKQQPTKRGEGQESEHLTRVCRCLRASCPSEGIDNDSSILKKIAILNRFQGSITIDARNYCSLLLAKILKSLYISEPVTHEAKGNLVLIFMCGIDKGRRLMFYFSL